MQAALIAMTIFGCDDSLNQCSYIDMAETRYATVQACDSEIENKNLLGNPFLGGWI